MGVFTLILIVRQLLIYIIKIMRHKQSKLWDINQGII